jgi:phosphoribosylaminoimidazolecarboxamide formyltransferase/IMP cyclohydrolase
VTDAVLPRALLSVSDKTGLIDFARGLVDLGFELVSTGGTARAIRDAGLEVTDVASVTGAAEMLDGRVKTLHPRIHAGILADQRDEGHLAQLADADIKAFSLVCVNLYPFEEAAARSDSTDDELIEEIDIGGPTLLRAAAKNHASVTVVCDPADYPAVLRELEEGRGLPDRRGVSERMRRRLALKAFRLTAYYDAAISTTLSARWAPGDRLPQRMSVSLRLSQTLRYGENPHQEAALYLRTGAVAADGPFAFGAEPLQGKSLSYNNLLDASAAAAIARDLHGPAIAIVKHMNPCGAAEALDLSTAWDRALATDPVSAFGGVVAIRGVVDGKLAASLTSLFLEVVVATGFDAGAREALAAKPDLRLLEDPSMESAPTSTLELRSAGGAVLITDADVGEADERSWRIATKRAPGAREAADLAFAWRVVRHVKSNAIVLARDGALVGAGAGQTSRIQSARIAVEHAGERAIGAVCASDAFFPFADAVEVCLHAGVTAIIAPGGSKRDDEVVAATDGAGAAMVMTARRHFRH